jgi:hypothetical protein
MPPVYCSSCGDRVYGEAADRGLCDRCRDKRARTPEAPPPVHRDEPPKEADEPRVLPAARDWDVPSVRLPRKKGGDWRLFGAGVCCMWAAVLLCLLAFLSGCLLFISAALNRSPTWLAAAQWVEVGAAPVVGLLMLGGLVLVCVVPTRKGVRARAFLALGTYVFLSAVGTGLVLATILDLPARTIGPLLGLGVPLALAHHICLFLLYSAAAQRLRDSTLSEQFLLFLKVTLVFPFAVGAALVVVMSFSLGQGRGGPSPFDLILVEVILGLAAVVVLVLLVWLLFLLGKLVFLCKSARPSASRTEEGRHEPVDHDQDLSPAHR